jgi:hypothetical protein
MNLSKATIKLTTMKKIWILPLTLLIYYTALAQENQFVVYSVKGNVNVVENNVESKAKIGRILTDGATIKVSQGSFATLICNENRMFSLNKTGNYNTGSLKDSCKGNNGSLSSNYLKYVWNELTKPKGTPEKNRKNYMSNVGAVSRSINNVWIDPKLDTVNYVSGTVPLSWKSFTDTEEFEFKLFENAEDVKPIFTKVVKKKHVDISDILTVIKPGKTYYWTSVVKGEENEDLKLLKYWTKEEYAIYFNSLKAPSGAAESDAEKNFRLGFVLEEAHFLAEAQQHYLKATQFAPDNVLYRSVFMSFKKDYEIK